MSDEPSTAATPWRHALTAMALVSTVMLTARQVRPLANAAAFAIRSGHMLMPLTPWVIARAATWVAISVAVLCERRSVAMVGAWLAVGMELVAAAVRYTDDPTYAVPLDLLGFSTLVAALVALVLTVSGPIHRPGPLSRRGNWILGTAAVVAVGSAMVIPFAGQYFPPPPPGSFVEPGFYPSFAVSSEVNLWVPLLTVSVIGVLVFASVSAVEPVVARLHVYTMLAATVVGYAAIQIGLPLPFGTSFSVVTARVIQVVAGMAGLVLVFGIDHLLTRPPESRPLGPVS